MERTIAVNSRRAWPRSLHTVDELLTLDMCRALVHHSLLDKGPRQIYPYHVRCDIFLSFVISTFFSYLFFE